MLLLLITAFTWTSCMKDNTQQPLSGKQIKQKVDSIMVTKTRELEVYGQKDMQHRMKIEVKVKADSIVNAHLKSATKDTAKINNPIKRP